MRTIVLTQQRGQNVCRNKDKKQLQAFIEIVNYVSEFLPHLASIATCLTDIQGTTGTCKCTDIYKEAFNQSKNLINNGQVIKQWNSHGEERKYVICNASDIGLGSWLG